MKIFIKLFLIIFLLFLCSCGTKVKAPDPEPKFSFDESGISIRIKADKKLNLYNGEAHSIVIVIYQLKDANVFSDLATNIPGIIKLLQAKNFDASITGVRKEIVQPGDEKIIKLPRNEGTKTIGIVAGYYNISIGSTTRMFDIPIIEKTSGFIKKTKTYSLGKLFINLYLGSTEINRIGG